MQIVLGKLAMNKTFSVYKISMNFIDVESKHYTDNLGLQNYLSY